MNRANFWIGAVTAVVSISIGCSNSDANAKGARAGDGTPTSRGSNATAKATTAVPPVGSANGPATAPSATANATPAASDGRALFLRFCALCHGPEAKGYAADNAPNLTTSTFLESVDDDFLRKSIAIGRTATPMASYGQALGGPLSDQDITAIIQFLRSQGPKLERVALPAPGPGDAKRGAAVYAEHCQRCHGTTSERGVGISLGNQMWLAHASDAFMRWAIVRGRPGTAMAAFEQKLSAKDIDNVIAFIRLQQSKPAAAPKVLAAPTGDEPVVINPKGKHPKFKLREGRFVAAADVEKAVKAKQRMVIIDARPPSEWSKMHIPGAISAAHYDGKALDRIPNDGTWVIAYCACPHHASGEVVDELRRRGYKNTAVLDEGILVWGQRGYPIASAQAVEGATLPATLAPGKQ